jgi:O-antigen ligase
MYDRTTERQGATVDGRSHLAKCSTDQEGWGGWLLWAFFLIGLLYPTLRLYLMRWTSLSSPALGSWQDILLCVIWVAAIKRPTDTQDRIVDRTRLLVILYLCAGVLSFLITVVYDQSMYSALLAVRLTYFPCILFFVARRIPLCPKAARRIAWMLVMVPAILAASGFILTYAMKETWKDLIALNSQERGWGLSAIGRQGTFRMTGTLLDPVSFSILCAYGTAIGINIFHVTRLGYKRVLLLMMVALCATASLLSLTRGSWISMMVIFLITFFFTRQRWIFLAACLLTITIILMAAYVAPKDVDPIKKTWTDLVEIGDEGRKTMWRDTWNAFLRQPWGYGLGQVGHIGNRFRRFSSSAPDITDGWYLKVLAEGGILLLVTFVAWMLSTYAALIRNVKARQSPEITALHVAGTSIFVAACIQSVFSNTWDYYLVSHYLWFSVGLTTRPLSPGRPSPPTSIMPPSSPTARPGITP